MESTLLRRSSMALGAREDDENGVEWGDDREAEVGLLLVR
jgi:hypothetical protein